MENLKNQTVYLEVNNNLDTAVCHFNGDEWSYHATVQSKEGYFFTPEQLNEYTANVIKQALETAAESKSLETAYTDDGLDYKELRLSKQSIANTFEESFNKFKV